MRKPETRERDQRYETSRSEVGLPHTSTSPPLNSALTSLPAETASPTSLQTTWISTVLEQKEVEQSWTPYLPRVSGKKLASAPSAPSRSSSVSWEAAGRKSKDQWYLSLAASTGVPESMTATESFLCADQWTTWLWPAEHSMSALPDSKESTTLTS